MITVGKSKIEVEDGGEYGFKIVEGWENRDGDFKPNFCKRQFGKDAPEKTVPLSIKIGENASAAAENLRVLADQIDGGRGASEQGPMPEDVPF